MVCSKSNSKRDVHSIKCLPQEKEKSRSKFTSQATRESPKLEKKKEKVITNIIVEIIEVETKKMKDL